MLEDHWPSLLSGIVVIVVGLYLRRIPEEMKGAVRRLDKRIDEIGDSVVFTDVFEQFEKTQDARHETNKMFVKNLENQMNIVMTNNAREHEGICNKLERIFNILIKKES